MKRLLFAFLLAACTDTTKTTVVVPPGPPADIGGSYHVLWPTGLDGTCAIGPEVDVGFAPYPCAVTTAIGGGGEYDPLTGAFRVEAKTIGGDVKVTVEGVWSDEPRRMTGACEVLVLGAPCVSGPIAMEEAQ